MAKCLEIPPRVRRRVPEGNRQHLGHGNTSACAEKSAGVIFDFWLLRKYLHVCGEEPGRAARFQPSREIPPRVRRRGTTCQLPRNPGGNTSACAEKSPAATFANPGTRKYLRVCGEEQEYPAQEPQCKEIPPRVRRRGIIAGYIASAHGNTSACAEKSRCRAVPNDSQWKYLRVCGEEAVNARTATCTVEIPPRVRRRGPLFYERLNLIGNTSACAEKRQQATFTFSNPGKYLRVCGEESLIDVCANSFTEIPPRVRRRDTAVGRAPRVRGNTSACAEKSCSGVIMCYATGKYLRVCGEENLCRCFFYHYWEIPPRVRRRVVADFFMLARRGNTSACAEKSYLSIGAIGGSGKYLRVCGEEASLHPGW